MTENNGIPAPAITSDNFHLSRLIPCARQVAKSTFASGLHRSQNPGIHHRRNRAEHTTRVQSDLRHFLAWGGPLPAAPEHVARYLADHAASSAWPRWRDVLPASEPSHVERGFPDPTKGELIRLTFRGIRRRYGKPQRRVAPLRIEHLSAIMSVLGNSTRDIRDRALLLVGFAGAFRRSEIAAIQCDSITGTEQGISITLRRSKTDQENRGRSVVIPKVGGPICPVAALERWMQVSGIKEGTLFRPLTKSGKVRIEGLSTSAVAVIVKQRATQIGLEPKLLVRPFAPGWLCNERRDGRTAGLENQAPDRACFGRSPR